MSRPSRRARRELADFAWLVAVLSVSFALAGWHFASASIENPPRVGLRARSLPPSLTVYNAWPKGRPYRVVCWLQGEPGPDPVAEMSRRAREAGADGLVLMGRDGKPSVRFRLSPSGSGKPTTAVAVRFLDSPGPKAKAP